MEWRKIYTDARRLKNDDVRRSINASVRKPYNAIRPAAEDGRADNIPSVYV